MKRWRSFDLHPVEQNGMKKTTQNKCICDKYICSALKKIQKELLHSNRVLNNNRSAIFEFQQIMCNIHSMFMVLFRIPIDFRQQL